MGDDFPLLSQLAKDIREKALPAFQYFGCGQLDVSFPNRRNCSRSVPALHFAGAERYSFDDLVPIG